MDKKQQEKIKEMFAGSDCSLFETDPEFTKLFLDFSQGEVPEKSRLTEKERMLCILSVLLGCQGKGEFRHMLHGALNTGLDPIAVKEILYQGTAYLGIGRTYDFLEIANQVMKEHNIPLPLEAQGTTDENSRFDKGLEKQVSLFGEGAWQNVRQKDRHCGKISTAGWQTTVLATTTPEEDLTTRSGR